MSSAGSRGPFGTGLVPRSNHNDERDDSSFLLVGRLAAGALSPGRRVASLVGNLAAKPDLSGRRDRLLQRIDGEQWGCVQRNDASHREVL